jgi:hypothetical protein
MQHHNQQWNDILPWMLATMAGVVLGVLSLLTLATGLALAGTSTVLVGLIGGAGLGGGIGIAQWLVLRCHARSAGWWIVASCLGWMAGLSLSAGTVDVLGIPLSLLAIGVVSGAATGSLLAYLLSGDAAPARPATAT